MPDTRVVVFVDFQNVCHGGRTLFGGQGPVPPTFGYINPLEYAQMVCGPGLGAVSRRVPAGVRVCRGRPVPGVGYEGVGRSFIRQAALWHRIPGVRLFAKPLGFSREAVAAGSTCMAGREKGADSMTALGVAVGAFKNSCGVAVALA